MAGEVAGADSDAAAVLLQQGKIGNYRWSMGIARSPGSDGGRAPCVVEKLWPRLGGGGSVATGSLCGSLEEIPTILAQSVGSGKAERTVLGILFRPQVVSVRLFLRGKPARLVKLRPVSKYKRERAGVTRANFAGAAFAGPYCLRRFVAYDRRGLVVDPGSPMACGR